MEVAQENLNTNHAGGEFEQNRVVQWFLERRESSEKIDRELA